MTLTTNNLPKAKFVSTREAAELVGYTTDYVARLARESKIEAKRQGAQWLINRDSLKMFALEAEAQKRNRKENLRLERLKEKVQVVRESSEKSIAKTISESSHSALLQTATVTLCLFVTANLMWFAFESNLNFKHLANGLEVIVQNFSEAIIVPSAEMFSQAASLGFIGKPLHFDTSKDFSIKTINSVGQDSLANFDVVLVADEEVVNESNNLQDAFSDEVNIEFVEEGEGSVTPIFRSGPGEVYRLQIVKEDSVDGRN